MADADKRLIPPGINDLSSQAFNELIDRLGTLDLTPLLIYIIDHVSSTALPCLADQFHIGGDEGWLLVSSDEERRSLIKMAIELHRYRGTPYAVESVLEKLNLTGRVTEWFDYGGEPYRFKVDIELLTRGMDETTVNLLYALVNKYKNVRSWLEELNIYLTTISPVPTVGPAILAGEEITVYPWAISEVLQSSKSYIAAGYQAVEKTTIYPLS
jgi:phage tail P2-like protein